MIGLKNGKKYIYINSCLYLNVGLKYILIKLLGTFDGKCSI